MRQRDPVCFPGQHSISKMSPTLLASLRANSFLYHLMCLRMPASLQQTDINPPVTIIQVYAPTSGHDDSEVDNFYQQLQETIDKTPKKDILVVQGDWNAKVWKDAQADWGEVCGPSCNVETNERGLRLLEFATFNNLVLANTLGPHKPSIRWTWHSPDGEEALPIRS